MTYEKFLPEKQIHLFGESLTAINKDRFNGSILPAKPPVYQGIQKQQDTHHDEDKISRQARETAGQSR